MIVITCFLLDGWMQILALGILNISFLTLYYFRKTYCVNEVTSLCKLDKKKIFVGQNKLAEMIQHFFDVFEFSVP